MITKKIYHIAYAPVVLAPAKTVGHFCHLAKKTIPLPLACPRILPPTTQQQTIISSLYFLLIDKKRDMVVQSSTGDPDENRSDNSIEEGPLVSPSYVQASLLTGSLSGGFGLELIDDDDDDGPILPMELMGEITSGPEVRGTPSSNPSNRVPPRRTSPPAMEMSHIEICINDDEDDGPELPPSMMPPAWLEMKVTGLKSKVDTIDENIDATREINTCIDRNNDDEYKLTLKHVSEYSGEGNFETKLASKHESEYSRGGKF